MTEFFDAAEARQKSYEATKARESKDAEAIKRLEPKFREAVHNEILNAVREGRDAAFVFYSTVLNHIGPMGFNKGPTLNHPLWMAGMREVARYLETYGYKVIERDAGGYTETFEIRWEGEPVKR